MLSRLFGISSKPKPDPKLARTVRLLLTAREPVHVVSQRLGHASGVITQTVYAHVLPGSQREAAERLDVAADGVDGHDLRPL